VLGDEFFIARSELNEALLDRCVKAGGNQYDVAVQYFIAGGLRVDPYRLRIAKKLCGWGRKPTMMSDRLDALMGVNYGDR
jgi:hypothetical protein